LEVNINCINSQQANRDEYLHVTDDAVTRKLALEESFQESKCQGQETKVRLIAKKRKNCYNL